MADVDPELLAAHGLAGDAASLAAAAERLERSGQLEQAATVYDRAYGLAPDNAEIAAARRRVLDRLVVVEHGIRFRFIPAGPFVMGADTGDPDESPAHAVTLGKFWLSETPVSWAAYCQLMAWKPAPDGMAHASPPPHECGTRDKAAFFLAQANKIRLQYCEDETTGARDWHAHLPEHRQFGLPPRARPERPWQYDRKPMISVAWQDAEELCARLNTDRSDRIAYRLPTEAEWEKAARGGLIGMPYAWGAEPPDSFHCDFDRFERFSILPMTRFPPNGYGLYAMCGGVWEWTSDLYDAEYYRNSPRENPTGPVDGTDRVLRGGSWSDCAEAITVSFRMPRASSSWRSDKWGRHLAPNIGFRLCRVDA